MFNVQSICTEAGKPADQFNVNCVGRRCVQIEGIDSVALAIAIGGKSLISNINNCCKYYYCYYMKMRNSGAGEQMNSFLMVPFDVLQWT